MLAGTMCYWCEHGAIEHPKKTWSSRRIDGTLGVASAADIVKIKTGYIQEKTTSDSDGSQV
jgi:hypothetical protein